MEPQPRRPRRLANALVVACFLVGIWLPLAGSGWGLAPDPALAENRIPAARPGVPGTLPKARAFPRAFESWFNDHFGFRGPLVRAHSILKVRGLGMAPSDEVVIGKHGWLYLGNRGVIDQYRAVSPMPPIWLDAWRRRLEEGHEFCEDRGARFLFVVAPNKVSIYPEHLPDGIEPVGDEAQLDQLLRHLREHSRVPTLDLRPTLHEVKARELAYRKTDTHWNRVGAFAAYRRLVRELRAWSPSIPVVEESELTRTIVTVPGGDLARAMGIGDRYEEEVVHLRPRTPFPFRRVTEGLVRSRIPETGSGEGGGDDARVIADPGMPPHASEHRDSTLPRLVMFRDSFAEPLLDFLSTGFSRAVYYWQRYFDAEVIVAEDPDIVVYQITERILMRREMPPNPPKLRVDFERRRAFRASEDVVIPKLAARMEPGSEPAVAVGRVPAPATDAPTILRLAITGSEPVTCRVTVVSDSDPRAPGIELDGRSLSAGLEIIYFDVPSLPSGGDLRVEVTGSAEVARVEVELRGESARKGR